MSEQEYHGLSLEGLARRLEVLEQAEAQRQEALERAETQPLEALKEAAAAREHGPSGPPPYMEVGGVLAHQVLANRGAGGSSYLDSVALQGTTTSSSFPAVVGFNSGSGPGVEAKNKGAGWALYAESPGYGGRFWGSKAPLLLEPHPGTGRPTDSGLYAKGAIYLDETGALFVCTATGTPGTWRKVTTTAA